MRSDDRQLASSQASHRGKCEICHSPEQVAIDHAYKNHTPLETIAADFKISVDSIKKHARAFPGLGRVRAKNLLAVFDQAIEVALSQLPKMEFKPQHITDLLIGRAKLSGDLVHLSADVSGRYQGWTDREMEHYILTGEKPGDAQVSDADGPSPMQEGPGAVQ